MHKYIDSTKYSENLVSYRTTTTGRPKVFKFKISKYLKYLVVSCIYFVSCRKF